MSARKKPIRSKKQTAESNNRWRPYLIWGGLIVSIIALGYLLFLNLRGPAPVQPIEGVVEHGQQSREHVEAEIPPEELPPVGGAHSPIWLNCGIYDEPVPIENAVHAMEHGALWIAYQPDLPQEQVDILRDVATGESFTVLSPFPGLRSPIVMSAWAVQLELDSADDDRVETFLERYQLGPTTPERGASCQGGVGTPIQ